MRTRYAFTRFTQLDYGLDARLPPFPVGYTFSTAVICAFGLRIFTSYGWRDYVYCQLRAHSCSFAFTLRAFTHAFAHVGSPTHVYVTVLRAVYGCARYLRYGCYTRGLHVYLDTFTHTRTRGFGSYRFSYTFYGCLPAVCYTILHWLPVGCWTTPVPAWLVCRCAHGLHGATLQFYAHTHPTRTTRARFTGLRFTAHTRLRLAHVHHAHAVCGLFGYARTVYFYVCALVTRCTRFWLRLRLFWFTFCPTVWTASCGLVRLRALRFYGLVIYRVLCLCYTRAQLVYPGSHTTRTPHVYRFAACRTHTLVAFGAVAHTVGYTRFSWLRTRGCAPTDYTRPGLPLSHTLPGCATYTPAGLCRGCDC